MSVKKYLMIGIFAVIMLFSVKETRAAERSCSVPLYEAGKNYYIDLDGDKKKEKIRYETKNVKGETQISLYVNNQVKILKQKRESGCDETSDNYWWVELNNFDTEDKYKEIGIHARTYKKEESVLDGINFCSYYPEYTKRVVYRYEKKRIKEYFSLPKSWVKDGAYIHSIQLGDGTICIGKKLNDICGMSDIRIYSNYKLQNGKLKRIGKVNEYYIGVDSIYEYDYCYRDFKSIKVRKNPTSSKVNFMLTPDDLFNGLIVTKVYVENDVITHAYIELGDGRSVWCASEDDHLIIEY